MNFIDEMFDLLDITPITDNLLLHQFSYWGPHYDISFDFLLERNEQNGAYVNILTFTQAIGQCCTLGDRVPGIYLKTDTENFHIVTQIGQDINKEATSFQQYSVNLWNKFRIRQFKINNYFGGNGEVMVRQYFLPLLSIMKHF